MAKDKRKDDNLEDTIVVDKIDSILKDVDEALEDTKEVESIDDVIDKEELGKTVGQEKDTLNEVEEKVEKVNQSSIENHKKGINRNIITIILICIICVLFVVLIVTLNKNRDKEDNDLGDNDKTNVILTEDDKKKMINSYGKALENVIAISYQKNQSLLSFDDANKLVGLKDDIICSKHEIYEDGKVYLANCSINGKMTDYSYGEKQEPKEKFDSGTMIKVYVNKTTGESVLSSPSDTSSYDEYTVHCNSLYDSPTLLGQSDYIFYYDSDYNVQMKNFKTDKKVLENISYIGVLPFNVNGLYDTKYLAVNINHKWGIYDIDTSKAVVAASYDAVAISLSMGVTGPALAIHTLKNTNIAVCKDGKYGVIDYTTGKEVIPVSNDLLMISGNYLWASFNDNSEHVIYDFYGNKYLTEGYDKVYGISAGAYVLVEQEGEIKLIQLDGTVLYNYGEAVDMGKLNFSIEYNNGAIFQFYKDTDLTDNMCIEYSYTPDSKTGEVKEIECGGIAKPILYLYPEKKMNVKISFSHPEYLETTYPKFTNYWSVSAYSNGDLYDKDNKYYYALYWDEKKVHLVDFSEGFYVDKDNAIEFLEEKLSYIGLNDKERNEFIMYWLPVLEKNEKSLVYFELTEERESYNKLLIDPKPDSMLRVVIHIKKVDDKVNIKKQSLMKFKRKGFAVVEWGGTTY